MLFPLKDKNVRRCRCIGHVPHAILLLQNGFLMAFVTECMFRISEINIFAVVIHGLQPG